MAVSAFTQLGAAFHSNTSGQSSVPYGAVTFPTNGQDVLGIMLVAVSGTATVETIGVTDSAGNVWTVVAVANTLGTGGGHTCIAYFAYPAGASNTTVTVTATLSASVNERDAVVGYATGHDTSTPLDTSGTFAGIGSTTSASVSTSASAAAGGLAVSAFAVAGSASPSAGYPSTGWTGIANPHDATRSRSAAFSATQVAAAGVVTDGPYTVTASSITPPTFSIAVFKAPGTPVNTVTPVVTGTAVIGDTLTSDAGTWTESPTSFAYQWQRDVGSSGTTWVNIAGETATTYVVTTDDVGCKLRCAVTATNSTGASAPAGSNATAVVATPSGTLTWRLISGPVAQSDNQVHTNTLALPVLPGDLVLVFAACSNANLIDGNGNKSDIGTVTDTGGHTWTQDAEAFSDANIQHAAQVFSSQMDDGLAYGSTITLTVHGGTGAGGYHGQSPWWFVIAVSTGDARVLTLDQQAHAVDLLTSHVAPSITTSEPDAIVFGFHAGSNLGAAGWWTPVAGFTEILDTPPALGNGGETDYGISSEVQVVSGGYTGGAGGTTGSNKTLTNVVAAYSAPATGGASITGAAALAGGGTITAAATRTTVAHAALTGAGSVAAAGVRQVVASATLSGVGAAVASAVRSTLGSATLTGLGSLAAGAGRTILGAANLTATGSLVATGVRIVRAAATLTAAGAAVVAAVRTAVARANLAGSGSLLARPFFRVTHGAVTATDDLTATVTAADLATSVAPDDAATRTVTGTDQLA